MAQRKRDKRKVDPLTGAEDQDVAQPLRTLAKGRKANAKNVVIPGTGEVVKDVRGKEAKRVVRTLHRHDRAGTVRGPCGTLMSRRRASQWRRPRSHRPP
jgi:hypothetical protein